MEVGDRALDRVCEKRWAMVRIFLDTVIQKLIMQSAGLSVQAPFNILDRRLVASGWLARLYQAGTEIHIRSVFLQGLLLMDVANRPEKFNRWQPLWNEWHNWLIDHESTSHLKPAWVLSSHSPKSAA